MNAVRNLLRRNELVRGAYQRLPASYRYDSGRVGPPADRSKRRYLLDIFRRRDHRVLIESGTYLGGTVSFFLPHAEMIYSVEIDEVLFKSAKKRFKNDHNVHLILGDAVNEVPALVARAESAPLLWLDGHFSSGDTGLGAEHEPCVRIINNLSTIDVPNGTTIVIDDLNYFGTNPSFPGLLDLVGAVSSSFNDPRVYVGLNNLVIEA